VLIRGTLTAPPAGFTTTIAVSAPLTIVGKSSAVIVPASGADAITITSGEIYLRNLTIQGTASPKTGIGINATPGTGSAVTLHMDTCAVTNNPGGGILLNGAAFDIKNTTITGNGAGLTVGYTWGGVLVQSLPSGSSATTTLSQVTIKSNNAIGLDCTGTIQLQGVAVLASGNTTADVAGCNVTACAAASPTCGAQSTPQ
jgi:nitrous oxidase accessory protein NosD